MNSAAPVPSVNQLVEAFSPLYSYKLPAWWQTPGGIAAIGGGILAALLCLAVAAWYRWWYTPPLTLAQWRLQELKALASLLAKNQIDHRRFFGATTFFLKQFLLKMYGWHVLDKTDDELWDFIQKKETEIPKDLHPALQDLLSYAQVAKFADAQAIKEKAEEAERGVASITQTLLDIQQPSQHSR